MCTQRKVERLDGPCHIRLEIGKKDEGEPEHLLRDNDRNLLLIKAKNFIEFVLILYWSCYMFAYIYTVVVVQKIYRHLLLHIVKSSNLDA